MSVAADPLKQSDRRKGLSIRTWRRIKEMTLGYTLLAPALILLLIFEIVPVFYGFYISTCDWKLSCVENLGLQNYIEALGDPNMWHSLLITATYSLISVPVQLGLGLVLAYLLFQKIRGQTFYRMMYFMPYITTTVASAAVWAYLYSPDYGPINKILQLFGMEPLKWLGETKGIFEMLLTPLLNTPFFNSLGITSVPPWAVGPSLALISLIIYTTWVFVGYDTVIFLSGLGNISGEYYDAAKVDGAEGWTLFRHITFPLLSPTTFFLLLITVIGTFKAFNHIFIMTQGGPVDATTTSSIFIFQQLQANNYGYSAALSFIIFIVIMALTIIQNQVAGKRVIYD
jgi:multiple sugar transport system permease protein